MPNENAIYRGLIVREGRPEDHPRIIAVLEKWWGGRDLTAMLPRLFLDHFCDTSLVVEEEETLVAFLVGFLSPARPEEAYIHFAGVHPDYRGMGIGTGLYRRFFRLCRDNGRRIVRSCTSPVNKGSVKFHRKMGFQVSKGDARIDGLDVTLDYNRPGDPKVCFVKCEPLQTR
jgi:L-amino acid N-acyltransferase YncA